MSKFRLFINFGVQILICRPLFEKSLAKTSVYLGFVLGLFLIRRNHPLFRFKANKFKVFSDKLWIAASLPLGEGGPLAVDEACSI